MLGVFLDEVPDMAPQCWDGCFVFIHGDGESVGLIVLLHVQEWVVVDVAMEVYIGSVCCQKRSE